MPDKKASHVPALAHRKMRLNSVLSTKRHLLYPVRIQANRVLNRTVFLTRLGPDVCPLKLRFFCDIFFAKYKEIRNGRKNILKIDLHRTGPVARLGGPVCPV